MIELAADRWRAALRPEIGGCLSSLTCDGVPVLRTMASDASHPLQSSCFALVPYCNRIADGRFTFGEREVRIAPNLLPQPHPLHGTGWLREWRVVRCDAVSALLEDHYDGSGEWPWPYRVHQHLALDAGGATIRLIVENRADEPAPMGLGLHPYFRRRDETRVTFEARAMLGNDGEFLPDGSVLGADALAPFRTGTPLPAELVDNCFTGWSGTASIEDGLGTIAVRGFGAGHCHVYAPPGGTDLCVEPVNHTPNALNLAPAEMTVLPPGAAAGIAMRIEATGP